MRRQGLTTAATLLALMVLIPTLAAAQGSTTTITFQGELADTNGNPVNGDYNMRFAIYDAQTGGTGVWPTYISGGYEVHGEVSVRDGLFNVLLGSAGEPFTTQNFDGGDRYMEAWVCSAPGSACSTYELITPRQPLSSVGYALVARTLVAGARVEGADAFYGLSVEAGRSQDYAAAIYGRSAAGTGRTAGVFGTASSPGKDTAGVWGTAGANGGPTHGVLGQTGSDDAGAAGVKGTAGGQASGVLGETSSSASGVYGLAPSAEGHIFGVYGKSNSENGRGVFGEARAASGSTQGVYGLTWSNSDEAAGVYGLAFGSSGQTYGVQGRTNSNTNGSSGVLGNAGASTGTTYGVQGSTVSEAKGAAGVYGEAASSTSQAAGVYGRSSSADGYGGYFENEAPRDWPHLNAAVYAKSAGGYGLICDGSARVEGSLSVDGGIGTDYLQVVGDELTTLGSGRRTWARAMSIEATGVYTYHPTVWIENSVGGYGLRVLMTTNKDYCPGDCQWLPSAIHALSIGTTGYAGYFENTNSNNALPALYGVHSGKGWAGYFTSRSGGVRIETPPGQPGLEVTGGTKSAVVDTSEGARRLYSEEATEVWFSDYGFGQLQDGLATVKIDPLFAETVSLDEPYHVFVQPYGDAELYVSDRKSTSFQVHLGDGEDGVEFSFRIVAKRKGYEKTRLELSVRPDVLADWP